MEHARKAAQRTGPGRARAIHEPHKERTGGARSVHLADAQALQRGSLCAAQQAARGIGKDALPHAIEGVPALVAVARSQYLDQALIGGVERAAEPTVQRLL